MAYTKKQIIVTILILVVIAAGLGIFFSYFSGAYLSTSLQQGAKLPQQEITSCADICTASCQDFETSQEVASCVSECPVLCENY